MKVLNWRFDRSPQQVTARLDALIAKIRGIQGGNMDGEEKADVVLVSGDPAPYTRHSHCGRSVEF